MLAVGPAMDGEYPQHEPPPAGSILYSPPPLQSPALHSPWWSPCPQAPFPAYTSESHQFTSTAPFLGGQPCPDTSYAPVASASSLLPKSGDFPQVGEAGRAVGSAGPCCPPRGPATSTGCRPWGLWEAVGKECGWCFVGHWGPGPWATSCTGTCGNTEEWAPRVTLPLCPEGGIVDVPGQTRRQGEGGSGPWGPGGCSAP